MIQANELRLGNWVQAVGDKWVLDNAYWVHGDYIQVTAYDLSHIHGCNKRDEKPSHAPIPLTPKILEQCGFMVDSVSVVTYKQWDMVTTTTRYIIMDGLLEITSTHNDHDEQTVWNSKFVANIKSLHQLQNLYYATLSDELTFTPKK